MKTGLLLLDIYHYSRKYFDSVRLNILHQVIQSTLTILTRCLVFSICSSGSLSLLREGKKKNQNKWSEQTCMCIFPLELLAVTAWFLLDTFDSHSPSSNISWKHYQSEQEYLVPWLRYSCITMCATVYNYHISDGICVIKFPAVQRYELQ